MRDVAISLSEVDTATLTAWAEAGVISVAEFVAEMKRRGAIAPKPRRSDILPRNLPPIGMSREVSAAYVDVSPSKFDEMVKDGRMPKPKQIDARRVWDRRQVEKAFSKLPGGDEELNEHDEWDFVA